MKTFYNILMAFCRRVYSICVKKNSKKIFRSRHENNHITLKIKKQLDLLESILEQTKTLIFVRHRDGKHIYLNARCASIFGITTQEAIGKTTFDLFPFEIAEKFIQEDKEIINTGKPTIKKQMFYVKGELRFSIVQKFPIKDKDGTIYAIGGFIDIIEKQKTFVQQEHGRAIFQGLPAIGSIQNATVFKQAQEELLKKERFEVLGTLAAKIAHDFNNLLGGIWGNIELALLNIDKKALATKYLNKSIDSLECTKMLTGKLLTFAKGGVPRRKHIQLQTIIESCARSLKTSTIRCDIRIDPKLPPVHADSTQMHQLFNNIFLNASQAMPNGGIISVVGTERQFEKDQSTLKANTYVEISIQDQGTGIPPLTLARIFDPFFTTKNKALGLGLTICHSIMVKHGGTILAESQSKTGTTITIRLPVSRCARPQDLIPKTPCRRAFKGRILVMEDEESIRNVIEELLVLLGLEVFCTKNSAEAIHAFKQAYTSLKPFNLVMLDLMILGDIGGEKTLLEIHKIDPMVRSIVVSGYADSPVLSQPEAYGFSGKLEKPFNKAELERVLQSVLTSA